jgi:hypothetical protein|tara:strand:- start:693 stop:1220 length:528 start_codon:yes stop_codon:yes gene_type:complete
MKKNKSIVSAVISILVIGSLFFQVSILSAYGQASDLEAKKARYNQFKIDIGDSRHAEMVEDVVADTITNSPFASESTKAIAQRYKDDHMLNLIWKIASLATPILVMVIMGPINQAAAESDQPTLSTINLSVVALGVASFVLSNMLTPKLLPVVVDSYNEDLRENLGLSDSEVMGL